MEQLIVQIVVISCFIGIILILFFDNKDFLIYSVLFTLIAALFSAFYIEEARLLDTYVAAIEWEVIFFFIPMFIIISILEPVFEEIAIKILRFEIGKKVRLLFMLLCTITTLVASFILALPTILIFIPIVIRLCQRLKLNPAPFMLGISVCVNLAATLTPFGSAQNVLIFNHFNLTSIWFLTYLAPFFGITLVITLLLLDRTVLKQGLKKEWKNICANEQVFTEALSCEEKDLESQMDPKKFRLNLVLLIVFFVFLFLIKEIYVVALIGCVVFVFLNPVKQRNGESRPDFSHYITKIDYKIIFFFICLFILTHLMELNGTFQLLEEILQTYISHDPFLLSVEILIITSICSGFLDNAPVTIIFLPIIDKLFISFAGTHLETPLLIAFILGINLGGNFLPQGSSADLMNLELAKQKGVEGMNYKKLTKVGAGFALLHIAIGIIYLWVLVNYILPVG